jgi:hypothetical protein
VKAALALDLLPDAASFCRRGLEQDPANEELKKLLAQVDSKLSEQERQRAKVAQAIATAKVSSCQMNITAILPFKCGEMTGTFVLFTGSCCCNGEERGEVWEGCFSRTNRGKEAKAG